MSEKLFMCPNCGVILTEDVWSRRKSVTKLHYICEKCGTKLHPEDLRFIEG